MSASGLHSLTHTCTNACTYGNTHTLLTTVQFASVKNTGKMKTAVLADMKTCFDKNGFWVDCFKMGTVAYGETLAGHGHCT